MICTMSWCIMPNENVSLFRFCALLLGRDHVLLSWGYECMMGSIGRYVKDSRR